MASLSDPCYDRLLMDSPLRRPGVSVAVGAVLLVMLSIAAGIQLDLLSGTRPDVASVFFRALFFSSLLAIGWRYALFGFGGHAMFTGIFGALLGLVFQTRRRWLRILAPIVGLALALGAHFWNNALPLLFALAGAAAGEPPPPGREPPSDMGFLRALVSGSLVELTTFLPFVVIMALALWRSGVWERRVIREGLAEVGHPVGPEEHGQIARDRAFRTSRIDRMHRRESAALVNAQQLAFRKRRVRNEAKDPEGDQLVAGWREEIPRLRHAEGGAPFSPPCPERPPSADDYRAGR